MISGPTFHRIPLRDFGEPNVRFGSKADIAKCDGHVRFVPKADICTAANGDKKGLLMLPPVALVL